MDDEKEFAVWYDELKLSMQKVLQGSLMNLTVTFFRVNTEIVIGNVALLCIVCRPPRRSCFILSLDLRFSFALSKSYGSILQNIDPLSFFIFIIWLAPWAGKMNQILRCDWLPERARWSYLARSELPAVSRNKNFPESHIINPLLTKFVQSIWLDIGLLFFLRVYGLWLHKHAKMNLANIQPSWPHACSINHIHYADILLETNYIPLWYRVKGAKTLCRLLCSKRYNSPWKSVSFLRYNIKNNVIQQDRIIFSLLKFRQVIS